jgi:hypothetical protein
VEWICYILQPFTFGILVATYTCFVGCFETLILCPDPVFMQVVVLMLSSILQAGNADHMKMVKDMGIAILTLPDGRVQLLHTFSNVSCHSEVSVKQEVIVTCLIPKMRSKQNNLIPTFGT